MAKNNKNPWKIKHIPYINITIHRGTNRISILIPWLHLVVKVARLRIVDMFRQIATYRKLKLSWKGIWQRPMIENFSIRWCLVRPILENISEYKFYMSKKYPVLQPTYFSLFGLINIQKCGDSVPKKFSGIGIGLLFNPVFGQQVAQTDLHHFGNSNNFCIDSNNRLRIVDYASTETQKILDEFHEKMYVFLDN